MSLLLTLPLAGEVSAQPPESAELGCAASGCHLELTQKPFVHRPVAEGRCTACHPPDLGSRDIPPYHEDRVPWALSAPVAGASCRDCHEPEPSFHAPADDPELDPCLRCHDPHGGATQGELIAPERELCRACHAKTLELPGSWRAPRGTEAEEVEITEHGPVAEGRCAPCHPAHPENPSDLLHGDLPTLRYVAYERAAYSACTGSCHPPALIEEERTSTTTRFRNGDDNLHTRHVVRPRAGRSCGFCHVPHLAANPALVRRGLPFGREMLTLEFEVTERGGRCTSSCHIPAEYDRDEAVPSAMRVQESTPHKELP